MQGVTYWNGTIWGSNAGALLVELDRKGDVVTGKFVLMEPGLGMTRANVHGTWTNNNRLEATLTQFTAETSVEVVLPRNGHFVATLDPVLSVIQGAWQTSSGAKGHFVLVVGTNINPPTLAAAGLQPAKGTTESQPPQAPLVTTTLNVGAVRLDQDGLSNLIAIIKDGTAIDQPAINASHRGREYIHIGIGSLLNEPALGGFVDTIIISANEPVSKLGFKTVVVRLVKDGQNTIFVSGYDRIWVEGKAKQIEVALLDYQNKMIGFWRKHGGNLNGIVFLALLGVLPSVPSLLNRLKVIGVTFLLLILLKATWSRAVNTRVFLHERLVPFHVKYAEYIVTPLAVAFSAIVALLIQRYVHAK